MNIRPISEMPILCSQQFPVPTPFQGRPGDADLNISVSTRLIETPFYESHFGSHLNEAFRLLKYFKTILFKVFHTA